MDCVLVPENIKAVGIAKPRDCYVRRPPGEPLDKLQPAGEHKHLHWYSVDGQIPMRDERHDGYLDGVMGKLIFGVHAGLEQVMQRNLLSARQYRQSPDTATDAKTIMQQLGKIFDIRDRYQEERENAEQPITGMRLARNPHTVFQGVEISRNELLRWDHDLLCIGLGGTESFRYQVLDTHYDRQYQVITGFVIEGGPFPDKGRRVMPVKYAFK